MARLPSILRGCSAFRQGPLIGHVQVAWNYSVSGGGSQGQPLDEYTTFIAITGSGTFSAPTSSVPLENPSAPLADIPADHARFIVRCISGADPGRLVLANPLPAGNYSGNAEVRWFAPDDEEDTYFTISGTGAAEGAVEILVGVEETAIEVSIPGSLLEGVWHHFDVFLGGWVDAPWSLGLPIDLSGLEPWVIPSADLFGVHTKEWTKEDTVWGFFDAPNAIETLTVVVTIYPWGETP